jgi:hypothetical protein
MHDGLMRARYLHGLLLGGFALLLAPSCRQIVGIGDEPPGTRGNSQDASVDATACGDAFPWAAGTCEACMERSCCAEATACREDSLCASEFECIAKCAGHDDACRTACIQDIDDPLEALWSCQARACNAQCDLDCGGALTWTPITTQADAGAQCASCLQMPGSCSQLTAFAACPSCLDLQICLDVCSFDQVCRLNCFASHQSLLAPDSGVAAPAYTAEGNFLCPPECQTGSDWACLGKVSWLTTPSETVSFVWRVVDQKSEPLVGARVDACAITDAACARPLSTTYADTNGDASLSVPSPFAGYFRAQNTGYVPSLLFLYPPDTQSMVPGQYFQLGLFSQSEWPMLGMAANIDLLSWLGVVYSEPVDCAGWAAPGISFTGTNLGSQAKPFYEVGGSPNGQATATSLSPTLVGGGFGNVAPGSITITAWLGDVKVSTVNAVVQPYALTYIWQAPSP